MRRVKKKSQQLARIERNAELEMRNTQNQMYPPDEMTALFDDLTVTLRPSSSGTAPHAKLTADGDRSANTLGVRVARASAEGRGDEDIARLSTMLIADGDLNVVRLAMLSAGDLGDADATLGSGRMLLGCAERMSLLERARGTGRPGRGLLGITLWRGGADFAVAGLPANCEGVPSGEMTLSVDGLPLIAVGGRMSAALKLEESK